MYKLIALFLVLFLAGCSPKYIVKNKYITPTHKGSFECVDLCKNKKRECLLMQMREHQLCLDNAQQRAREISDREFARYERSYENYLMRLRSFEHNTEIFNRDYRKLEADYSYFAKECHSKKDRFDCRREIELKNRLLQMKTNRPLKPRELIRPSFYRTLEAHNKEHAKLTTVVL